VGFVIGGGGKNRPIGNCTVCNSGCAGGPTPTYEICKFHHNLWQKIPAVKPGIV